MTAYLFLDLETAGLAHDAPIFEVACVLTNFRRRHFHEVDRYRAVRRWDDAFNAVIEAPAYAMHEASGLLADMRQGYSLDMIDAIIERMIGEYVGDGNEGKVHIAGSGVSHFDLRRVQDQMPLTAKWLHWRPLDVGQLEEWRKLTGLPTYEEAHPEQAKRKTHRAMDDVLFHLDEANWYLEVTR